MVIRTGTPIARVGESVAIGRLGLCSPKTFRCPPAMVSRPPTAPRTGLPLRRRAATAAARTARTGISAGMKRRRTSSSPRPDTAEVCAIQACVNQW